MSEEASFLAAIAAQPDDDTARLVYADWLQDRADPRAEYLRLEVARHRMPPRQLRTEDPFHAMDRLRSHATPGWLSRIDRTTRYSMFWPQFECDRARLGGLVGQPLAKVGARGNHNTQFPKAMGAGDYIYVFAFRGTLLLVGRMRIVHRIEEPLGNLGTWTSGMEGEEGTPVRFDLPVPNTAVERLQWLSGKKQRGLRFDANGRMTSATPLHSVLRLTPPTAADLDAILRGDFLS